MQKIIKNPPSGFFLGSSGLILLCNLSCLAQGNICISVIFKDTIDMFHGTISWKIKSSFNGKLEKISAQ